MIVVSKHAVRRANEWDAQEIVRMGRMMHNESRYRSRNFSAEKVRAVALYLMRSPKGIMFIGDHGFVAGGVDEDWYGTDLTASEYALFVEPEHRGGMLAARLVKAYAQRAKMLGATDVQMENSTGVLSHEGLDIFARLVGRLGFEPVGGKFSMGCNGVGHVQSG